MPTETFTKRFFHSVYAVCEVSLSVSAFFLLFFLVLLLFRLENFSIHWAAVFIPVYFELIFLGIAGIVVFVYALMDHEKQWWKHYALWDYVPFICGIGPWTFGLGMLIGWIVAVISVILLVVRLNGNHDITFAAIFWPPIGYMMLIVIMMVFYWFTWTCITAYRSRRSRKSSEFESGGTQKTFLGQRKAVL